MISPLANIWGNYEIGAFTKISAFCDISAKIGSNCNIQCHVSIPPGVTLEDNVFVGPGTVFTNDRYFNMERKFEETLVEDGVRIGANCTILSGIRIGKNAIIGAGSVVTKSVPDGETWIGNPANKIK